MLVTIEDENDNPPEFSKSSYSVSIPENLPDGTQVLEVAASDKDEVKWQHSYGCYKYCTSEIYHKMHCIGIVNSAIDITSDYLNMFNHNKLNLTSLRGRAMHPKSKFCLVREWNSSGLHKVPNMKVRKCKVDTKLQMAPSLGDAFLPSCLLLFLWNQKTQLNQKVKCSPSGK